MASMIKFHNRMEGTTMEVLHADDCTLLWRREEEGIVAINKCGDPKTITVDTRFRFKWFHPYQDVLTEESTIEITGPSFRFEVPARSAQMWVAN